MDYFPLLTAKYGYVVLFPLAIVEGPIITIAGGFLASLGLLNPLIVYGIVLAGDAVGDTICYLLGRWGGRVFFRKIGPSIGLTEEKLKKAETYFDTHGNRAITLSKLIHGIGIAGLIAAGSLRIPYRKYITICFSVTLVQALVLLIIGAVFGHAYKQLSVYINYFAVIASIAVIMAVLLFILYRLRFFRS